MASHSRILWLHERIIRGQFPSLKEFSEHFGISQRQASREISYLRNNLQAPLLYSRANKGYYYNREFSIPALFAGRAFSEGNEKSLIQKINPTLYNVLEKSLEVKVNGLDKKIVPVYVDIRKETIYSYFPEEKKIEGILIERFNSTVLTGKKFHFVFAFDFDKFNRSSLKKTLRCVRVKIDDIEKILLYVSETEIIDWLSKNTSKNPQLVDKQIKEKLRRKILVLKELLE
ncbi:MAG: hypothetical protein R6U52_08315 [Kosmotogaceae bacterium]